MTEHQGDMLAQALGDLLVSIGMIRPDAPMTGPELIVAAETYCQAKREVDTDPERNFALEANPPVKRDDGRYYVPVSKEGDDDTPILRVSTDIFDGDMDDKVDRAIEFACDLTARWNRGPL